jgi:hypothetical protein
MINRHQEHDGCNKPNNIIIIMLLGDCLTKHTHLKCNIIVKTCISIVCEYMTEEGEEGVSEQIYN